jgi:hypothetical protein
MRWRAMRGLGKLSEDTRISDKESLGYYELKTYEQSTGRDQIPTELI